MEKNGISESHPADQMEYRPLGASHREVIFVWLLFYWMCKNVLLYVQEIVNSNLPYKMGHYFLDRRYLTENIIPPESPQLGAATRGSWRIAAIYLQRGLNEQPACRQGYTLYIHYDLNTRDEGPTFFPRIRLGLKKNPDPVPTLNRNEEKNIFIF